MAKQFVFAVLRRDFESSDDMKGAQTLVEVHSTLRSANAGAKNHLAKESAKATDDSPEIKEGSSKDGLYGAQCETGEDERYSFKLVVSKIELQSGVEASLAAPKPKGKAAAKKSQAEEEDDKDDEDEDQDKPAAKPDKKSIPSGKTNSLKGLRLIFTGTFTTMDRKTCEATAKTFGAQIMGPTKLAETDLVVLGDRPGQKKIDEIQQKNLKTVTEADFLDMVETGKAAKDEEDDEDEEMKHDDEDEAPPPKATAKRPAAKNPAAKAPAAKKSKIVPEGVEGSLEGLRLLFTGTLNIDRKTCEATAEKYGAEIVKKLEDTDYVILGTKPGPKKVEEINAKNLTSISEAQFFEMLQGGKLPERK